MLPPSPDSLAAGPAAADNRDDMRDAPGLLQQQPQGIGVYIGSEGTPG